ncbi:MAG: alpha/beta hydrolase [Sphaerochaetaceae bacterium]|nr:alpha/beta hydrolase [Sphaerochaetaceae bacterium]
MKHDTVEFNGKKMDYCVFGSGERILVLIPGMSLGKVTGAVELISSSYSLLSNDFTIYLFDRVNDMYSGYSTESMAEDTVLAMKSLGLGKISIIGYSQGGMIAQLIAINYPELVDKLVIGSSASRINATTSNVVSSLIAMAKMGDIGSLTDTMADKLYTKTYNETYGVKAYYRENPPTQEDLERFTIMAEAVLSFNSYDSLSKINAPTLVIGVEKDEMVTGEASEEIAEKLSCSLIMYKGYKHAVYDEAPDYKEILLKFLLEK